MKILGVFMALLGVMAFTLGTADRAAADDGDKLTDSEWVLVSYAGTPVSPAGSVTLIFERDNNAGGNGGCNQYGAEYTLDDANISFSAIFSTRRFCDGLMEQERAYFAALEAATSYALNGNQLVILYGDGDELIFERDIQLVGSGWQLVSFGEEPIVEDSIVTLDFGDDQRAFGTGGCNSYGGPYTFNDEGEITFGMLVSTMMACLDDDMMAQEVAFFNVLSQATRYEISAGMLTIFYGEEDEQLVFQRAITLTETQWVLTLFNGQEPLENTTITMMFDDEGNVLGSSGCNSYGGGYSVQDDEIEFSMMSMTLMACLNDGVMEQEQAFLQALGTTVRYEIFANRLTLTTPDGISLIFEPLDNQ